MMIALGVVMLGLVWLALGFIGYAIFAALAASLGVPGAALATAGIFLVVAALIGFIVSRRVADAKRNAMLAGLAGSGVANAAVSIVAKRPLLALGIGGALAAFFLTRSS